MTADNLPLRAQDLARQGLCVAEIAVQLGKSRAMTRLYLDPVKLEAHRAKARAKMRARYAADPAKQKAHVAAWRAKNREKVSDYGRKGHRRQMTWRFLVDRCRYRATKTRDAGFEALCRARAEFLTAFFGSAEKTGVVHDPLVGRPIGTHGKDWFLWCDSTPGSWRVYSPAEFLAQEALERPLWAAPKTEYVA